MKDQTKKSNAVSDTMSIDFASVLREIALSVEANQNSSDARKADIVLEKILKKARKAALKGKFSVTYWWADFTAWVAINNLIEDEYHHIKDIKPSILVNKLLDMKFTLSIPPYIIGEGSGFCGFYKIFISWKE